MNSIQAELLELYGMLGDSVEKYKKCVSDILDKGEIKAVYFVDALIKYSILLDKMRHYQDAIDILNIVIDTENDINSYTLGIALANRSQMYYKIGDYEKGNSDLEKAICLLEREDKSDDAVYQLSLCYVNKSTLECQRTNRLAIAEADINRAIELTENGQNYEIRVNRARALLNYSYILEKKEAPQKDILNNIDAAIGEGLILANRCYLYYELYKAYHLLLKYDKSYINKIMNLLENTDKTDYGNFNWVFSALRDIVINSDEIESAYNMMKEYLEVLQVKKIFLQEDIKYIIPALGSDISIYLKENERYSEACILLLQIVNFMEFNSINIDIWRRYFCFTR